MLKFKGPFEKTRHYSRRKMKFVARDSAYNDFNIPTVDEVDEVMAPMYADTVLQILHGQGIYWGWEIKREVDNDSIRKSDLNPVAVVKQTRRANLIFHYNGLDKAERKVIRMTARLTKITLHKAIERYMVSIKGL
jgi:hypothetical protein